MILRVVVLFISVSLVFPDKNCNYQPTCEECIKASGRCYWCVDGDFDDEKNPTGRCSSTRDHCPSDKAYIAVQSKIASEKLEDRERTLYLRDDETFTFTVEVEPQPAVPFDLYFLIDGSRSMLHSLDSIKSNSKQLAKRVTEKWIGSKVGLGLFNDKEATPFTFINLTVTKLAKNIPHTEFPFWKMATGLTEADDLGQFNKTMDGISIRRPMDPDNDPEAQIDVIAQTLTCTNDLSFEAGRESRHVIYLLTDAPFWTAGDGRLGGIIQPSDGRCRGSTEKEQSDSSILFDYPSVGFLKKQLQQTNSYLVTSVINKEYEKESKFVRSYSKVNHKVYSSLRNTMPLLTEYESVTHNGLDELNLPDLNPLNVDKVMGTLEGISNRVSLVASGDTEYFNINTHIHNSKCPATANARMRGAGGTVVACDNVPEGIKVPISISIKVKPQLTLGHKDYKIRFNLPGVHSDKDLLTVTVKHLEAKCDEEKCTKQDEQTLNDKGNDFCNNNGKLVCGKCDCNDGFHGLHCDCSEREGVQKGNQTSSLHNNCFGVSQPDIECNGNGMCHCGECECRNNPFGSPFVGTTCGCDPDSCPKDENEAVCFGRGSCICDEESNQMKCVCDSDKYDSGTYCKCTKEESCIDPDFNDGFLCNHRGYGCSCDGICLCRNGFTGDFCQKCTSTECIAETCLEERYINSVLCNKGKLSGEKCDSQNKFTFTTFSEDVKNNWQRCTADDPSDNSCRLYFHVNTPNLLQISIDPVVVCGEATSVALIVFNTVTLVFLVALLITTPWKLYVLYQERMDEKQAELEKAAEKEKRDAKKGNQSDGNREEKIDGEKEENGDRNQKQAYKQRKVGIDLEQPKLSEKGESRV